MKTQDIATAKEKLAIREGLNGWKNESKKKHGLKNIGYWSPTGSFLLWLPAF